jgi:hypothetical protein
MGLFQLAVTISSKLNPPRVAAARCRWPSGRWRRNAMATHQSNVVRTSLLSDPPRPTEFRSFFSKRARTRFAAVAHGCIHWAHLSRTSNRMTGPLHPWMLRTVERGPPVGLLGAIRPIAQPINV